MTLQNLNTLEIHFPEKRSSQGKLPAQRETSVGERIDVYVVKIGLVDHIREDAKAYHDFFDKMDLAQNANEGEGDWDEWNRLYNQQEELKKKTRNKVIEFLNQIQNEANKFVNLPEIVILNIHASAGSIIWNETRK